MTLDEQHYRIFTLFHGAFQPHLTIRRLQFILLDYLNLQFMPIKLFRSIVINPKPAMILNFVLDSVSLAVTIEIIVIFFSLA